jgi:integration host factor subunit alpha
LRHARHVRHAGAGCRPLRFSGHPHRDGPTEAAEYPFTICIAPLTPGDDANIVDNSAGYLRPGAGLAMTGKTVTRADLCEAVYQKVGLSRTESAALVELVLKEITDCLERGETVKLSSFGSFVVRKKGQRIGRNPKTGKEVPISPRRVMVFKPSAILKHRINGHAE